MKAFYERLWQQEKPFGHWTDENFKYHHDFFKPYIGKLVLDYGCGSGEFLSKIFLSKIIDVGFGYDISPTAIEKAHKNYPWLIFPLLLKKQYFDTICLIDVLEHIPDLVSLLEELRGLLKVGGHLLIATNELSPVKGALISLLMFEKYFSPTSPHLRYFTKHTLKELLEDNGFEVVAYKKNRTYLGILSRGQMVVAKLK